MGTAFRIGASFTLLVVLLGAGVVVYGNVTRPQTPWEAYTADIKSFVTDWVRNGVTFGTLCGRLAKVRSNHRLSWHNHPDRYQFRGATPEDHRQLDDWLTQVLVDQGCPA